MTSLQRDADHLGVRSQQIPDDAQRIMPLIGNDELKLCVDARGVMHDLTHQWSSHPPPRITWAGRRHDRRYDRYNSNLFEWGFLDLHFDAEPELPEVSNWSQRLHPRDGYVETTITRGDVVEHTLSFVHLERNVIVFRRWYENLPACVARKLRATYTLCHVGTDELPFRVSWQPGDAFERGIAADTTADGMWRYRGRIALFADAPADAHAIDNRLELDAALASDDAVTICLSLNDDLGDHPQILDIEHSGWMTDAVGEVHEENQKRLHAWRPADYAGDTDRILADVRDHGFEPLFSSHTRAWNRWFDQVHLELPKEETDLRTSLSTQLYTMRCSYTAWSSPANPFNTSWGAPYFWDERFPTEGLMQLGITDMPERTAEWRRTILPFSTMMSGGRGARYVPAATETGSQISDRNATQYYEFFTIGVIANYLYQYCRYFDSEALWRRYYPIFRECAEFFRRYLVIELPGNNVMVTWLVDVNETYYPVQDGSFTTCGAARIFYTAWETAERLDIDEPLIREWKRVGSQVWHLAHHTCSGSLERDSHTTTADNPVTPYIDYELADQPIDELEIDSSIRAWRDEYRRGFLPESQMQGEKTNLAGETEHLPFWSWGPLQTAHSAAMQHRPDEAMRELRRALTTMMDFGALNESAKTDLSDVHHPWFNTAAGAFVRALTRMLVYPRGEVVYVLPGIPEGWSDLSFTLPIYGGGRLSVELREGVLALLSIAESASRSQTRRVHVPERFLPETLSLPDGVREADRVDGNVVLCCDTVGGKESLLFASASQPVDA